MASVSRYVYAKNAESMPAAIPAAAAVAALLQPCTASLGLLCCPSAPCPDRPTAVSMLVCGCSITSIQTTIYIPFTQDVLLLAWAVGFMVDITCS